MSIKNDLKQVKQELSNDEKMLESVFRFEAFLKRNKKILIGIASVLVLGFTGYQIKGYLDEQKALKITAIFDEIQANGESKELLEQLKKEGGELYEFVSLTQALKNQNKEELSLLQKSTNSFIAQYAKYELSSLDQKFDSQKDYGEFKNLALLQEGYELIIAKKHKEALEKLNAIEPTSELKEWALRIGHYGITK